MTTHKNIKRKVLLVGLAALMAVTGILPIAEQEVAAAANKPKACNLATSIIANIPKAVGGTKAQQRAYLSKLVCAINAVPSGQSIYMSTYSLDVTEVASALIAAHKRGVIVRITVWNERAQFAETQRLIKALGTNIAARSYVKVCLGSCLKTGADDGIQHAKAVTISKLLGPNNKWLSKVTFVGSANPTYSNAELNWNTTYLFVGNTKLYNSLRNYIYAMRLDRTQKLPAKVTSGKITLYYSPGKLKKDAVLKALKATKCKAPKGYGLKGKTVIRVAMYEWTMGREAVANQLVKLKKKGCDVRIIINNFSNENHQAILPILRKGGIPVEDGRVDTNRDGKAELSMHEKTILISGKVSGKGRTLTFTGSRNWTRNAVDTNTELLLLDRRKATMTRMLSHWNFELAKIQALKRKML